MRGEIYLEISANVNISDAKHYKVNNYEWYWIENWQYFQQVRNNFFIFYDNIMFMVFFIGDAEFLLNETERVGLPNGDLTISKVDEYRNK